MNTEVYGVNLRIQAEYRKIRTRKNSVFGHFSRSVCNSSICKLALLTYLPLTEAATGVLCQSLFFDKVAGRPATLLQKRLRHRCFPVNFVKFLRTSVFIEHLWWLLLHLYSFVLFLYYAFGNIANVIKIWYLA